MEPEPPAAALLAVLDPVAAAIVAAAVAAGEEVAIEDGERVALGFFESGCEYLKGVAFFVEPRPEAVAKRRKRAADALTVGVASPKTLPSPSVDGVNGWILIMS